MLKIADFALSITCVYYYLLLVTASTNDQRQNDKPSPLPRDHYLQRLAVTMNSYEETLGL